MAERLRGCVARRVGHTPVARHLAYFWKWATLILRVVLLTLRLRRKQRINLKTIRAVTLGLIGSRTHLSRGVNRISLSVNIKTALAKGVLVKRP
jgi:hypothetical protein